MSHRAGPRRLGAAALIALGLSLAVACSRPAPGADAGPPPSLAAVPAPEGLLAIAWIRAPDALWSRLQLGVSGALALLPPDVGSLLVTGAGLDPGVATLIDGRATAFAVLAQPTAGDVPAWAVALELKDPPRARSRLLDGDAAPFSARQLGGLTHLDPGGRGAPARLALAGRWLLIAHDEGDLARLGPYVAGTVPGLPPPSSPAAIVVDAGPGALANRFAPRLRALWGRVRADLSARDRADRARHGGRAPDFGDPQAILAALDPVVERRAALLQHARSLRIEIDADESSVHLDATLVPGDADVAQAAAMRPGDPRPILEAPAEAVAALVLHDDAASRASDALDLEAALSAALAPRAKPEDDAAMKRALDDWAAVRGDWLSVAVTWSGPRGVWLRSPAGAPASHALRELVDLGSRPLFAEPLRHALDLPGDLRVEPSTVAGVSDASVALLARRKGEGPLGAAWGLHDGALFAAAGEQPAGLLGTVTAPGARLGDDPRVARALAALGADATLAVIAEPLRLLAARATSDAARAPAVLAWGRRGDRLWAHADVAGELLREIVRSQAGL